MEETKELTRAQALNEEFKDIYRSGYEDRIYILQEGIKDCKSYLERYYNSIRCHTKELKDKMIELEAIERNQDEKDFSKDIENILNHKLVEKVEINIDKMYLSIFTDYIDIYDEKGNKFAGNSYEIRFNFERMSVRIFGTDSEYNKHSYWSDVDPHPHVSGDDGYPCLGDAGPMLAQTLNDYELYASFIITLNFLQQVNTNDVAGKNIKNWDCIDEKGVTIENPYKKDICICANCETEFDSRDDVEICNECGENFCIDCIDWVESVDNYVCHDCINNYYSECADCDELTRNEYMYYVNDGDFYVCEGCCDNNYTRCDSCDERFKNENIAYREEFDEDLCNECYEEMKREKSESGAF